jgi:DNA-binding NarL/FixJ family response regulator
MSSYKIVLADDHVLLRDGIKRIIEESSDLRVVAEASDGLELLRVLKQHDVDMVLLDISMPGLRGIEAVREVKISFPSIKVLILTMHKKKEYIRHAFCTKKRNTSVTRFQREQMDTCLRRPPATNFLTLSAPFAMAKITCQTPFPKS